MQRPIRAAVRPPGDRSPGKGRQATEDRELTRAVITANVLSPALGAVPVGTRRPVLGLRAGEWLAAGDVAITADGNEQRQHFLMSRAPRSALALSRAPPAPDARAAAPVGPIAVTVHAPADPVAPGVVSLRRAWLARATSESRKGERAPAPATRSTPARTSAPPAGDDGLGRACTSGEGASVRESCLFASDGGRRRAR
jgi:hypothetical protein